MKLNDTDFLKSQCLKGWEGVENFDPLQARKKCCSVLAKYYQHDKVQMVTYTNWNPVDIVNSPRDQIIDAWWDSTKKLKLVANQYFVSSDPDAIDGGFLLLTYADLEEESTD
jgi:hypothetical protein